MSFHGAPYSTNLLHQRHLIITIDNDQLTKYDLSENDMVLSVEQLFSKVFKKDIYR